MRIDLPFCNFKNCRFQLDGNCTARGQREYCILSKDIVEVVRCGKCRFREEHHYEDVGEKPYIKFTCKFSSYSHSANHYCSLGEKE